MTDPVLSPEQQARAEALRVARAVLAGRSLNPMLETPAPDVVDLHAVAVFILDGGDPWAPEPMFEAVFEGDHPEPGDDDPAGRHRYTYPSDGARS